jgi:pimeloyl-ACP methyl ester carboxylesterase
VLNHIAPFALRVCQGSEVSESGAHPDQDGSRISGCNTQVRDLTRAGFRVVMFDRRGHGRSQMTGQGYEFDTLADDLDAVIDQLGLADITLVGHSMGTAEIGFLKAS